MKRITIVALALALLPGLAMAQNITRSLQGSQDPRGPVGIDTSNSAYFPGHINAFGQSGTLSTASCGAATGSSLFAAGSTDAVGSVYLASNACQIFFGSPFNAAPVCVTQVSSIPATAAQSMIVTTTTTGMIMTNAVSGTNLGYICLGNK